MPSIEIPLPIQGLSKGLTVCKERATFSGYMLNVRPRDTLSGRIRMGKRPGLKKAYSQQIGNASKPIVELLSVTIVS